MRFETRGGVPFEIPDDWWSFAEMDSFSAKGGGFYPYRECGDAQNIDVVLLSDIEPPMRSSGVRHSRSIRWSLCCLASYHRSALFLLSKSMLCRRPSGTASESAMDIIGTTHQSVTRNCPS
jgi:hypothetical protein